MKNQNKKTWPFPDYLPIILDRVMMLTITSVIFEQNQDQKKTTIPQNLTFQLKFDTNYSDSPTLALNFFCFDFNASDPFSLVLVNTYLQNHLFTVPITETGTQAVHEAKVANAPWADY